MPVAAIESLVSLLQNTPSLSTISETLDLLATNADILKRSSTNPISLSAGTDLFQRYIINSLQRGGPAGAAGDFSAIRTHLLNNGRLFAARAKEARRIIAQTAKKFVRTNCTVLTNGGSRVVSAVLQAAAETQTRDTGAPRFQVVYAIGTHYTLSGERATREGSMTVKALRKLGVPVATISEAAVAYSMARIDVVLVGAEGVVENGGIISRMGTYQMAVLAKASGKPMYVAAESHKFVRAFPLGQQDIGVEQNVLDFTTELSPEDREETGLLTPKADMASKRLLGEDVSRELDESGYFGKDALQSHVQDVNAVDYTPPEYISALISENGVLTSGAISEELIKIWY